MNAFLFALGLVVVLATGLSVLFTMVLPRRPAGIARVSLWINRGVRLVFVGLTRLARSYEAKDAILAPVGPVALVAQLMAWAAAFILGFALMLQPTTHNLADGLLQALGSLFTVGTIHPGGAENLPLDVAAGAIWVVVVALQIAYLPALYAAFSQREGLVAMLESRAGVPAWGPELLARHQLVGIIDTLPELYSAWEEWAAAVAESHTTYPVLLLFRSPEPWFSWLLALLAVLDGAAMHLALSPATASSNARLCLRMGFTALDRIGSMLGWQLDPDPLPETPIDLTYDEFDRAVAHARGGRASPPSAAPKRPGPTSTAGGSTTRRPPTAWPTGWSCPRRPGPGPAGTSAAQIVEPRRPPHRRPATRCRGLRAPLTRPNGARGQTHRRATGVWA